MASNTPAGDRRRSISGNGSGRTSIGAGRTSIGVGRASLGPGGGGGGIPRAGLGSSRISAMRAATTQPSFDFLTGGESQQSNPERPRSSMGQRKALHSRHSSTENLQVHPDEHAALKTELNTLKYTLSTREQEQELLKLRQEAEIRDVRRKGEEDFRKMQLAEGERNKAVRLYEEVTKEMNDLREQAEDEKKRAREINREGDERLRALEEAADERKEEAEERIRVLERRLKEAEAKNLSLERLAEDGRTELLGKESLIGEVRQTLAEREGEIGNLESEVLRLKAQTGDVDTLGIIKRELSEQVAHIRTLEATNREQLGELKHFRRLHKSVEVVEEEKRALQRKVDSIEGLQQDLGEARLQRQRLEDERLAWTAYLQSQAGEDGRVEFDSPEAIARALVQERFERATLLEKLGGVEPQLAERDSIIKSLESEKTNLEAQMEKLKTSGGGDTKVRTRLERQRNLALKEVEYLRAQLKTFDAEESTMELASFDEAKAQRIQQLEDMVAQYSTEVKTLHDELVAAASTAPQASPPTGTKRPREDSEDSEQLGQLSRKNRKLQAELSTLQTSTAILQKELSVSQERLKSAITQSKTRVLSLRSNPTSDAEAIKLSTLSALRAENAALLSQLQTPNPGTASVPLLTLEAAQRDCQDMARLVADTEKSKDRLKRVWGAKTLEFREGVSSLMGWKVDFLPNGKMRVESLFYPGDDEGENSIIFDGENGTMKVSGGPRSLFALKIANQIKFWVKERGEIPCLLAQLTMDFYEESTKAGKH